MKPKIPRRTGKSMEFKKSINESISTEFILDFNIFNLLLHYTFILVNHLQKKYSLLLLSIASLIS